jgi:hypothetical protein
VQSHIVAATSTNFGYGQLSGTQSLAKRQRNQTGVIGRYLGCIALNLSIERLARHISAHIAKD